MVSTEPGLDVQVGIFTTGQYLIFHGCIVTVCLLLAVLRVLPFTQQCVSASTNLHNTMFSTMLRGIMRFFDTSSSGNSSTVKKLIRNGFGTLFTTLIILQVGS